MCSQVFLNKKVKLLKVFCICFMGGTKKSVMESEFLFGNIPINQLTLFLNRHNALTVTTKVL